MSALAPTPVPSSCMPAPAEVIPLGAKRPVPVCKGGSLGGAAVPPPTDAHCSGSTAKKPRQEVRKEVGGEPSVASAAGVASPHAAMPSPKSLVPRYLLRVQYDGSNFHGFQRQAKARTVQGCVEDALTKFMGRGGDTKKKGEAGKTPGDAYEKDDDHHQPVISHGSSRTDAGVHALDATLHVDLERVSKRHPNTLQKPWTANTVMCAVNHFLKRGGCWDAKISQCIRVDPAKFHARYSATARTYRYRIRVCDAQTPPSIFEHKKVWHVVRNEPLDVGAMRLAAAKLIGTHDFSSFRAAHCQASGPIRSVDFIGVEVENENGEVSNGWALWDSFGGPADDFSEVRVEEEEEDGKGKGVKAKQQNSSSLVITTRAPSFLYHQVRLIVGTLKAVGCGDMSPSDVEVLLAKKDPMQTPTMAPACGLYLARVHYDGSRKWDAARTAGEAKEEHELNESSE
jgi:tRNA pseudouridine38-40 synthase|mmetsp:Transcript_586/g.2252  ORF Transcript_586/g.2252 Transcript_586/m.2252 type:complete len:455 (-) Transcript_586:1308-2672(-)